MDVTTLKTRLYALLQPIIGGTVIWSDQSVARPALPYTTLRLGVVNLVGGAHYSNPDANGMQRVLGYRESTLNIERFGSDSVAAIETVANKLTFNTISEKFSKQEISAFDISDVTDIAQLLNGIAIEPRASVDVRLRWASDLLDDVGLIEEVNTSGSIGPDSTAKNESYLVSSVVVNL